MTPFPADEDYAWEQDEPAISPCSLDPEEPLPPPRPTFTRSIEIRHPLESRLADLSDLDLAQVLASRLTLTDGDWHRRKGDRRIRSREQVAAALVYLLRDCPEEALPRLQQAVGWLDRSLKAPPCPDHGH